ncbi:unnamed protein product [Blepharisma stoltei]|uniref:Rhodanese domain-containing protein n=1 Tax=Blepharisma stoltei TaxID=1481888 RepID=A0AAU9JSE0_9CILI|nr:unnamed protein product [Blepharisma stoltei]
MLYNRLDFHMSVFISYEELKELNPESYMLIYCLPRSKIPAQHVPGSFLFYIEDDPDLFIKESASVELDSNKAIVCYGTGDRMEYSCKAYWGFRAAGATNIHVLLGGFKLFKNTNIELSDGAPPLLKKRTGNKLQFDRNLVMTSQDFLKKQVIYHQIFYLDAVPFNMIDIRGNILTQNQVSQNLSQRGFSIIPDRAAIVHGAMAGLLALLLKYLDYESVAIVIGDTKTITEKAETSRLTYSAHEGQKNNDSSLVSKSFLGIDISHYTTQLPESEKIQESGRTEHTCYCTVM